MRAIVQDRFGGTDVLHSADIPVPKPAANEVLIQVAYAGVNRVDCKIREGRLKDFLPHQFPLIPGWDVSGIVIGTGEDASLFKTGDKIYAYARKPVVQWGAYAEFIALNERNVARMPKNLGFKDAAAVPLAGLTAWQALFDKAHLKSSETILIHAGAGGVGSYALQLAKNAGAGVLTTASLRNHALVRSLGADYALDYAREDFVAATRAIVKNGVDVVLDLLGGDILERSFAALRPGGRLVSTVQMPDEELARKHQVTPLTLFIEPSSQQLTEMAIQLDDGRIKVPPIREVDLKDAAAAQSLLETGHVQGKIVLKVK